MVLGELSTLQSYLLLYIAAINIVGTLFFCFDKVAAIHAWRRTPERILHLLEFLGGFLLMLPFIYLINHKRKKWRYYAISYAILVVWTVAVILFIYHLS